MEVGTGIFWAGAFYFLVKVIEYGYAIITNHFPSKQAQRLDKIESTLKEFFPDLN